MVFKFEFKPIHLRLLGQKRFKLCLGPYCFLLWLKGCMLETSLLLSESMSSCDPSKIHKGGCWAI